MTSYDTAAEVLESLSDARDRLEGGTLAIQRDVLTRAGDLVREAADLLAHAAYGVPGDELDADGWDEFDGLAMRAVFHAVPGRVPCWATQAEVATYAADQGFPVASVPGLIWEAVAGGMLADDGGRLVLGPAYMTAIEEMAQLGNGNA